MIYTYKNFSEAKLASQLNSGDSQMTVTVASTLPTTGTFIAVIWNAQLYADAGKDPDVEIVLATLYSGYVFNLTRAQEGTTAKTHVVGTTVGLYLTAAAFNDLIGPQGPQGNIGLGIVSGMILMWSGSIGTIPTGWVLCDGSNSTPDLRNRFVIAAGDTYAVDATGDGQIPAHTHSEKIAGSNAYISGSGSSPNFTAGSGKNATLEVTGSSGTGTKNIAVYYALAYIMKT